MIYNHTNNHSTYKNFEEEKCPCGQLHESECSGECMDDRLKPDPDDEIMSEIEHMRCYCGAYKLGKNGIVKVSDCICGYG